VGAVADPVLQRWVPGDRPQNGASALGRSVGSVIGASRWREEDRAPKPLSEDELRNLARRIYPYISQRLKVELRRDRERAGMITGLHR
jgi:hypothetical protein